MTTLIYGDTVIAPEQLSARVARIAGGFYALGVREGEVVALMLKNEPVYIEIMLAMRLIGAYYCPINWHFKGEEAGHILRDSGARLLVIDAQLLEQIRDAIADDIPLLVSGGKDTASLARNRQWQRWDTWLAQQSPYAGPPPASPRGNMPYTSGTTGRPKGVRRQPVPAELQASMAPAQQELVCLAFGIEAGIRTLMAAPMYHSAPNLVAIQAAINDGFIVIEPRFDAERVLALIEQHKLNHIYLVPTLMVRLLRLPEEVRRRYDLSSMRYVSCMGSSCPPEVKRAMIEWWGPVIYESYAASELGAITVITPQEALKKPGSVGRPARGAVLKILDGAGKELPARSVGTIYARQPAYTDFTYNNNPQARNALECDGLWTVGDMGYVDADGYLFICDRATDMVISGGVNIYPVEIEHVLMTMPGVADCAVFGIPDAEFGEALAAAVQLLEGHAANEDAVKNFLADRIAGYKVPRLVEFHAALPREDTGKLYKRRLRDPHWVNAGRRI